MRTFVAIPLPDECRTLLDRMQQKLRSYDADVRWVAVPSIHLTLKFLGEVDPNIIPKLSEALENDTRSQRRFSLRLHGMGCFPHQKNPRVIWYGIDGETENLSQLQQQVETTCARFGFDPENRDFHPHLTLGRVNGKRNLPPLIECIKMGTDWESSFAADRFNIYKSILKPQGAVYSILKTIALSGW
jgi:RNA 2',3'-cyclic 3'-phosphodiesterase